MFRFKVGDTDRTIYFKVRDSSSSTGGFLTGLAYNTAGLKATYTPYRGAATAITLATLAAANSAHADGGFKEVDSTLDPGLYRLDLPDAALSAGPYTTVTLFGAANMVGESAVVIVQTKTIEDAVEDTENIQSRIPTSLVSGRIDASVGAMANNTMTAAAAAADLTTELQSGLATASALTAVAGYIDTEVLAIKTVTDKLDTALELDGAVYRLTANALEQAPSGGGGGLDAAGVRAAIGLGSANLDTQLAGIVADAADIQTRLPAALVGGRMDSSVGAVATGAINRAALAADTGLQSVRSGTAQAGAAGTITLDASASAITDYYENCLIYITGGVGVGQTRLCSAYNGSTKVATITPNWDTNPDNTSTFAVLPMGQVDIEMIGGAVLSTTAAQIGVNVVQISADATAADNLEAAYDDTAGAVRWHNIIDVGTAQAATSTTLQLRAAAAFADDELNGCLVYISGGTTGVGQVRRIVDYVGSTDTATIDAAWTTTPTGTITYRIIPAGLLTTLDAAAIRAALGMASANMDTQLSTIDTVVDAVLVDTAEIGAAGAGLTALGSAANLAAVKAKTDTLPSDPADHSQIIDATNAILSAVATVDGVVDAIKITADKLDTAVELDGSVWRLTANALEEAPTGYSSIIV